MAKATKVAVLGVDAMDPRLTKKYKENSGSRRCQRRLSIIGRIANRNPTTVDHTGNWRISIHPWDYRILSSGRRYRYGKPEL